VLRIRIRSDPKLLPEPDSEKIIPDPEPDSEKIIPDPKPDSEKIIPDPGSPDPE
jgi:hypothetical protein